VVVISSGFQNRGRDGTPAELVRLAEAGIRVWGQPGSSTRGAVYYDFC
jgi:hypothetical protein